MRAGKQTERAGGEVGRRHPGGSRGEPQLHKLMQLLVLHGGLGGLGRLRRLRRGARPAKADGPLRRREPPPPCLGSRTHLVTAARGRQWESLAYGARH